MKRWIYKTPDLKKVEELSRSFQISPFLATLLVNRNITHPQDVDHFLYGDFSKLHNPYLLPNIEAAVIRTREALDRGEKILVYGDKDVDGVTGTALLVRTLKSVGAVVDWTIPTHEGYGLHNSVLEKCYRDGVRLVITADCGTSAVSQIEFATEIGLDVIVTDHHSPPESLPKAVAIVNPNLPGSRYPMKQISGSFTAFKFASALLFSFNRHFNQDYCILDFETTGLSNQTDQIVEIGALQVRNFVIQKEFHALVHPTCPISREAFELHRISEEMVRESPSLETVLPSLLEFIGNRTIVAHNAKFDLGFLQVAVARILRKEMVPKFLDTLALARSQFPMFPSHSLPKLARELHIKVEGSHRALADCHTTASIFQIVEKARDPRLQFFQEEMLDLGTLGTVADVVPLRGENRVLVRYGLPALLKSRKPGIKKLLQAAGFQIYDPKETEIPTAKEIAWRVTPLLNAAGRFLKPSLSVRLLLSDSEDESAELVQEILDLNESRKELQKTNHEHFYRLVEKQSNLSQEKILILAAEGIQPGVTGIIANRMTQEYQRPVVLLVIEGEVASGSSRSIPGFNLVQALKECEDLLLTYGGHPQAAGLQLPTKNVEPLRLRLLKIAQREISREEFSTPLEIDLEMDISDLTPQVLQEIQRLEPFGEGNPAPLFSLKQVQFREPTRMGPEKNHVKLRVGKGNKFLDAIGWGMSSLVSSFDPKNPIDCVFEIEIDKWGGGKKPRLVLSDIKILN